MPSRKGAAVQKAKSAAKTVKKGAYQKKALKIRTSVHFRRPKTLCLPRNAKYERRSAPRRVKMDKYRVIRYPVCTESAKKRQISQAVSSMYDIEPVSVNTLIRPDGQKKA